MMEYTRKQERCLVIGCGPIGRVLVRHLALSGCSVVICDVPDRLRRLGKGIWYYPLNERRDRWSPVRLMPPAMISSEDPPSGERWDQVYLCVSSERLDQVLGDQADVVRHAGVVVKTQTGLRDKDVCLPYMEADRLVSMFISVVAYRAPLQGEFVPRPGTAYWRPLFVPSVVSGKERSVERVVHVLRRGRMPIRRVSDAERLIAFTTALLIPACAGLMCAGWSIEAAVGPSWMDRIWNGSKQAIAVTSGYVDQPVPGLIRSFNATRLRFLMRMMPRLLPFPLEAYLRSNETTLHERLMRHLSEYVRAGGRLGVPTDALFDLLRALKAPRTQPGKRIRGAPRVPAGTALTG